MTGVEFQFFDKSLNFVCKNSKLKEMMNLSAPPLLAIIRIVQRLKTETYGTDLYATDLKWLR